jgi:hypothetical protein
VNRKALDYTEENAMKTCCDRSPHDMDSDRHAQSYQEIILNSWKVR